MRRPETLGTCNTLAGVLKHAGDCVAGFQSNSRSLGVEITRAAAATGARNTAGERVVGITWIHTDASQDPAELSPFFYRVGAGIQRLAALPATDQSKAVVARSCRREAKASCARRLGYLLDDDRSGQVAVG